MRLATLVLVSVFAFAGCTKSGASSAQCTTASDCEVICYANASDCCGDACGCEHAFTKAEAADIMKRRNEHCSKKDLECPEAKCVIKQLVPACTEGKCVAVPAAP